MRQIEDLVRIMNINWAVNQLPDTFSAFRLKILMNLFRPFRLFKDLAELLILLDHVIRLEQVLARPCEIIEVVGVHLFLVHPDPVAFEVYLHLQILQ